MKSLREQIAGWCIHYRGRHEREFCEAGVRFDDLRDTAGRRSAFATMPCFAGDGRIACPHRAFPTAEQVEAEVAASDRAIDAVARARRAIAGSVMHRRGSGGTIDCPICGTLGALAFSVAYNGHIHAKCRTAGCVAWME